MLVGADPVLRGDPNRTLGLGGPANPSAGKLYVDGNWRGDIHYGDYRELRLSASYTYDTKRPWLGRHHLAGSWSKAAQTDINELSWLSLVGSPFNAVASNANNRIAVRNYFTEGDHGTYRAGDWRALPAKFNFGGRSFDLAFANDAAGANNSGMRQDTDSLLGVLQSYFWRDKLVATAGYRVDRVAVTQFGYYVNPVVGDHFDRDPAKATVTHVTARTQSVGAVYHVAHWLSLIGNKSSNVGVPTLARTVFPLGNLAPLSHGKGEDYGIGLDLFEGRVSDRFVYLPPASRDASPPPVWASARKKHPGDGRVCRGPRRARAAHFRERLGAIHKAYTPPANAIASNFVPKVTRHASRNLTRATGAWSSTIPTPTPAARILPPRWRISTARRPVTGCTWCRASARTRRAAMWPIRPPSSPQRRREVDRTRQHDSGGKHFGPHHRHRWRDGGPGDLQPRRRQQWRSGRSAEALGRAATQDQLLHGLRFQGRLAEGHHYRRRLALAECERHRFGLPRPGDRRQGNRGRRCDDGYAASRAAARKVRFQVNVSNLLDQTTSFRCVFESAAALTVCRAGGRAGLQPL